MKYTPKTYEISLAIPQDEPPTAKLERIAFERKLREAREAWNAAIISDLYYPRPRLQSPSK